MLLLNLFFSLVDFFRHQGSCQSGGGAAVQVFCKRRGEDVPGAPDLQSGGLPQSHPALCTQEHQLLQPGDEVQVSKTIFAVCQRTEQ